MTEGLRLDTTFGPNVKGVSRFKLQLFPGTISTVENTASKLRFLKCTILYWSVILIASSDYERIVNISTSESGNTSSLTFVPHDDDITLEYDDRVTLTFTPINTYLIDAFEATGEFVRHRATVNIIDTDS